MPCAGERRGCCARTRNWWELRILFEPPGGGGEGGPKRFVVLEKDGRPEGYAIYRHKPKWDEGTADSELQVVEAVALDGRPTAEIWRYLLDIDWAARITASLMPVDHPLWWLLATPRSMRPRIGDGLWVRLVDVGAALSARRYVVGRRCRLRRDRRVLPVERRSLAPRARPGQAHDVWRTASPGRERARQRVPRSVLVLRPRPRRAGSRSCGAVPPRARTRCSPPSAPRGVPRSSEPVDRPSQR